MLSPRGRTLIIFMIIFNILTLTSVALRFYVLFKVKRRAIRADDYIILISTASLLAVEGAMSWAVYYGLGTHTAELEWYNVAVQIRMQTSTLFTWTIATCTCKLAILFMYLDIFRTDRIFRKVIWVLIVLTACYAPVFIPYFMTQCSPVSAAWDEVLSQTNCRPLKLQEIASVAVNLVLDTAIVVAPLPIVWGLKMPMNKKIGVSAMFSLGIAVVAVMIWRLITTARPDHGRDMVFDLFVVAIQGQLEIWLGILAANIPTLGPLLNRIPGSAVSQYVLSAVKGRSTQDSSTPARGISLKTFGSYGKPERIFRDEFHRLDDEQHGGNGSQQGIMRDWEVRVSVDTTPDRAAAEGYSARVRA